VEAHSKISDLEALSSSVELTINTEKIISVRAMKDARDLAGTRMSDAFRDRPSVMNR